VTIAVISLWIAIGAVTLTTALAAGLRAYAAITGARRERYRGRVSEQLAAYAVGASDETPPQPRGTLEQRVVHEELARLAPHLKGDAHELLGSLFTRYGLIDSARRDVSSDHPLAAIRAAELIGIMGAADCEALLRAQLRSEEPLVRLACARALADLGSAAAIPEIVAALWGDGGNERELGEILHSFGASAEPFLCERLRDAGTARERRLAAVALGEIHATSAVPELIEALSEWDDELCARAARALGAIGDTAATRQLIVLLERPRTWFVRVAAATALGMLDDPRGAPALARALDHSNWAVRNAAARALVELGAIGLEAVLERTDRLAPSGIAHYAGLLDVADRLEDVIARAATGEPDADRFVRQARFAGVQSRLQELAASDGSSSGAYAAALLGHAEAAA
jgi:HEAT repeat protein